jgi:hypothetical protein
MLGFTVARERLEGIMHTIEGRYLVSGDNELIGEVFRAITLVLRTRSNLELRRVSVQAIVKRMRYDDADEAHEIASDVLQMLETEGLIWRSREGVVGIALEFNCCTAHPVLQTHDPLFSLYQPRAVDLTEGDLAVVKALCERKGQPIKNGFREWHENTFPGKHDETHPRFVRLVGAGCVHQESDFSSIVPLGRYWVQCLPDENASEMTLIELPDRVHDTRETPLKGRSVEDLVGVFAGAIMERHGVLTLTELYAISDSLGELTGEQ